MVRTQILLTEAQARALRELAAAERRSMADLVRNGVDRLLEAHGDARPPGVKRRALAVVGRFHSGVSDLGTAHDRHLAEVFER